jgi:hypothetical protein
MRIKIASLVLFTAWFSAQALAQWDWQPYPPPPPPPPPSSLDQPDFLSSPPRQQRQSRPANRERLRPAAGRSTQSDARQGNVQEQKLRNEIQTKRRKAVAKQQRANKATVTGSVTSSSSAEKSPTKPQSSTSAEKKKPSTSTSASAGTKARVKAASHGTDLTKTPKETKSPSKGFKSAQHKNDLSRISSDARRNPAVVAFRICIASHFARGSERKTEGTWADLLTYATEGECRPQFDDMARNLSKQFSKDRVEQVMQQLIETTLLPAAKAAARGNPDTGTSAIPPQ